MFKKDISKQTSESLAILNKVKFVGRYFLAGGTTAALHLGHRLSYDLDFFTKKAHKLAKSWGLE